MKRIIIYISLTFICINFSCTNKGVPAKSSSVSTLRVMTYNVHHCNPPSKPGLIDIDAIARVIKNESPDLVALQEIDVNVGRSGKINQAAQIAIKSGYPSFYFAKAIDYDGGEYGVMILSKYPLSEMVTHKLPTQESTNGEHRVLALTTVNLPGGKKIKFGSTHLDAQRENTNRLLQVKEISRITGSEQLPVIIGGDFNAVENSEVMQLLVQQFKRSCTHCAPTIPVINPDKTIDFIVFKPKSSFSVLAHKVVQESYASDHLPVVANLAIN